MKVLHEWRADGVLWRLVLIDGRPQPQYDNEHGWKSIRHFGALRLGDEMAKLLEEGRGHRRRTGVVRPHHIASRRGEIKVITADVRGQDVTADTIWFDMRTSSAYVAIRNASGRLRLDNKGNIAGQLCRAHIETTTARAADLLRKLAGRD